MIDTHMSPLPSARILMDTFQQGMTDGAASRGLVLNILDAEQYIVYADTAQLPCRAPVISQWDCRGGQPATDIY